jgi:hypothetical protein
MSGPELELRIAVRAEPGEIIVATWEEIDARERLRVTAVQPLREPDNRGQHPDGAP